MKDPENLRTSRDEAAPESSENHPHPALTEITSILAVLEDPYIGISTSLMRKAGRVCTAFGAGLHLLHICYDDPPILRRLGDRTVGDYERSERADKAATSLAELALTLSEETGVEVGYEVLSGRPESALIIEKARQVGADLIMKESCRSNYFVGLLTNTDWELLRRSPANLWFVGDADGPPARVLAAIGNSAEDDQVLSAEDYDICAFALMLTDAFHTRSTMLHTYTTPLGFQGFGRTEADPSAVELLSQAQIAQRQAIVGSHREAIQSLIDYFQLDVDRLCVVEGQPSKAIPEAARALEADAVIMGAETLNRLERFIKPVSAEPVLAHADCDVIFVRQPIDSDKLPDWSDDLLEGHPAVDLEKAVMDPAAVFQNSPARLATDDRLSRVMRKRLLRIWENDIQAEMNEENEGGLVEETPVNLLDEVHRAQLLLDDTAADTQEKSMNPEFS